MDLGGSPATWVAEPGQTGRAAHALADCAVYRPDGFGGGVEITVAPRAPRHFPTRVAAGLGICLKVGGAHAVRSDGRALIYPADALCIRYPDHAWSSAAAEAGFLSIDIAPRLLPPGLVPGAMRFLHRSALPGFARLAARLRADEGPLHRQETLASLIAALFACGALDAEALRDDADRQRLAARAREFLAASGDANPTLDQLASAVGANKYVVLRHFKREHGITPHAYLIQRRVERARGLLARGAGPTEVAAMVGFADLSHLSRHFKRIVGVSPGDFARRLRA